MNFTKGNEIDNERKIAFHWVQSYASTQDMKKLFKLMENRQDELLKQYSK